MLRLQERDEEGRREGAALSAGVRTLSKGGPAAMAAGLMSFWWVSELDTAFCPGRT